MSKDNKFQLHSPLFLKYQNDFEKNPRSRVFAPLAESYRKMGMIDKAMEVLSQGIRFHPSYTMGYLGLAFCYFDLGQFNLAYSTLIPITESNRDNLRLQKLFSDTCLELGKQEEALETLKYLLFINPRNKEIAESVSKLEHDVENRYKPHHKPIIIPEIKNYEMPNEYIESSDLFNLDKLKQTKDIPENDFDNWKAIDLNADSKLTNEDHVFDKINLSNLENWDVVQSNKTLDSRSDLEIKNHEKFKNKYTDEKPEEDIRDFKVETKLSIIKSPHINNESETPLITHTLVDLYCGQGHIDKALVVLQKILLLNPNDQKTIQKISEIESLIQPAKSFEGEISYELLSSEETPLVTLSEISEEDGRRHLMSLIDEKLNPVIDNEFELKEIVAIKNISFRAEPIALKKDQDIEKVRRIEEKLSLFLKKIQKRALDYQDSV